MGNRKNHIAGCPDGFTERDGVCYAPGVRPATAADKGAADLLDMLNKNKFLIIGGAILLLLILKKR